ncbi:hypothetical protein WJX82_006966 [Trebouxia sp. C0006]
MEEIGAYSGPATGSSANSASVSYNSAASAAHDPSISDLQSFGVTSTPADNTGTTSHPEASPARTYTGMASRTAPSGATTSAPGTSPSSEGNTTASSTEPVILPESGGPSVAAQAPIAPVAPVAGQGFSHAAAAAATATTTSGPGFGMAPFGVPSSVGGFPSSQTSASGPGAAGFGRVFSTAPATSLFGQEAVFATLTPPWVAVPPWSGPGGDGAASAQPSAAGFNSTFNQATFAAHATSSAASPAGPAPQPASSVLPSGPSPGGFHASGGPLPQQASGLGAFSFRQAPAASQSASSPATSLFGAVAGFGTPLSAAALPFEATAPPVFKAPTSAHASGTLDCLEDLLHWGALDHLEALQHLEDLDHLEALQHLEDLDCLEVCLHLGDLDCLEALLHLHLVPLGLGSLPVQTTTSPFPGFGLSPSGFGQPFQANTSVSSNFGSGPSWQSVFGQPSQASTYPYLGFGCFLWAPTSSGFGPPSQANTSSSSGCGLGSFSKPCNGMPQAPWRINPYWTSDSQQLEGFVHSISAMIEYLYMSSEELRWEDYQAGRKGSTTANTCGGKDAISKCSGQYDAANWLLSAEEDIQRDGSSDASDQVQHSFQPTRFDKELVFVAGYACRNPSAWTVFKTWNVELKWMATQLDVFRLQRLVAAVARLTLRQRMQLVFEGYRARFAKIGAITLGDLDYLNQADLTALQLTPVTLDTMVKCMQSGLCKTPIALEFPDAVSRPHMLIKAWLKSFGLGSCASLFDKQGLHTMQDVPMLSEEDMLSWQGRFKQGLPFRKLKKLFASLRLNLWWSQMHANGYLPQNCKSALIGHLGITDKLQDIWHRYGSVLDQGFGMRTPDDLMDLHAGDLDSLTDFAQGLFSPAVSHFLHSLAEKRPDKERKMLPPLADVHALPASGLGRLMDWLLHPQVQLAAYLPFFKEAGEHLV